MVQGIFLKTLALCLFPEDNDRHGRDRMVEFRSWRGVLDTTLCDKAYK